MSDVVKLLSVKLIRLLAANTGVAAVVVVVVKLFRDADLGIG